VNRKNDHGRKEKATGFFRANRLTGLMADTSTAPLRISALSFDLHFHPWHTAEATPSNRVLKNKHQAVSQGVRRFGKRSLFSDR
jgi:hypothetical protein